MIARFARWYDEHPLQGDVGLAAAVLLVVVLPTEVGAADIALGLAFSLALVACLPFRRRAPAVAFAAVSVLCLVQLLVLDRPVGGDVVALIVLYTVVAYGRAPQLAVAATVGAVVGAAVASVRWEHAARGVSLANAMLSSVAVVLLTATLGTWRRSRRAQLAALRERNRLLAVERDQQAAVGAAMERARIARELHDVVAHSLSVVVVQADGAAANAAQRPEAAVAALRTIAETGHDAPGQMRRLLGVLREGPDADSVPWAPAPGVAQLEELVAQVADTGLPVRLSGQGAPRPLAATIDATLYRLTQEALTNVLKHAGSVSRVDVVLRYRDDTVELAVRDDGRGVATPNDDQGHGVVGMRERVELHDGTLVTGAGTDGGFSVEAIIPTNEQVAARA